MPLYKSVTIENNSKVLIWKIEEPIETLQKDVELSQRSQERFSKMKSELHQKAFMGIRQLLKLVGYNDNDLIYDQYGKPHLKDGKFVSITHSFEFCGLIISDRKAVGIDIEKQRDKIKRIVHKFTIPEEYEKLNKTDLIRKLTVVWGAKESLYKIYGKKQLLFREHIYIEDFNLKDKQTTGEIRYQTNLAYTIHFLEFEGFTCVYALA